MLRSTTAAEVILVEIDDLDLVVDMIEWDRIVGPVKFVEVHRALVMAVNQLARSGEGVDLAWVDLFADLFDQDADVVALGFVEGWATVLELAYFVPHLILAGRVKTNRRCEFGGDRVEDRDLVSLLSLDVFFQSLLLRGKDREGERPSRDVQGRDVSEYVIEAASDVADRNQTQKGTRQ